MFHYLGTCQNKQGDALPGWYVEAQSGGAVVPIYADAGGTLIQSVSGVNNRAKVDTNGNFDFWIAEGTYDLYYYNSSGVLQPKSDLSVNMGQIVADLASTSTGKGAALVATTSGITVQNVFDNYVTIPAVLSTSGDQSTALQTTINNSAFAGKRRVQLGEGTFAIKDVSIPSGTVLQGKGIDRTILQRASALSQAILSLASGASDVVISDMTIDGLSAADAASLVRAIDHGSRLRFERVKFVNACQRWALRFDPSAQFKSLDIIDCVFDNCPKGGIIMLPSAAAVAGSSDINIIGNTWTNCGLNLCQIRPYAPNNLPAEYFQFDFYYATKFNFNQILSCQSDAIPNELWGHHGLQQIGNYLDSGTRGLSAGEGQRNGIIAFNVIKNQTLYAMEGGNNADNVHITRNIVVNCASFTKATGTGTGSNLMNNVLIEDNIIQGSGLSAYQAVDCIALGNDGAEIVTNCRIRDNYFNGYKFGRSVIRVNPIEASSNEILIESNIYIATDANDAVTFINPAVINFVSRNNRARRTADFASTHGAGSSQVVYSYGGRTSATGARCVSENDVVEMTGTVSSGSFYALGRIEAATARYGMRVTGFRPIGNFSAGPFQFPDSTGTTILENFDIRGLTSQSTAASGLNASLALGLVDGTALIVSGGYVKAGPVGTRARRLHYAGSVTTRTVIIRCDVTSGGITPATFNIDFVGVTNNGTPSANRVTVAFASASSPNTAPLMFQGGGTAATLSSALNGSLMEATVTLPAMNNTWMASISAEAGGTVGNGINDYSVRIA